MNVAVIGAGNGGQALAAWISNCGHNVKIYDRNESRVKQLKKKGFIELVGEANFRGFFAKISTKIDEIVFDADLIFLISNPHRRGCLQQKYGLPLSSEFPLPGFQKYLR